MDNKKLELLVAVGFICMVFGVTIYHVNKFGDTNRHDRIDLYQDSSKRGVKIDSTPKIVDTVYIEELQDSTYIQEIKQENGKLKEEKENLKRKLINSKREIQIINTPINLEKDAVIIPSTNDGESYIFYKGKYFKVNDTTRKHN